MDGIHQTIFQVIENVTSLIGVITNHAEKARLVGPVKDAIGRFAKYIPPLTILNKSNDYILLGVSEMWMSLSTICHTL